MAFLLEIVARIQALCGPGFPISVRLSVDEFQEGGLKIEDSVKIAQTLEKQGVAAINVSAGVQETGYAIIEPQSFPEGWKKHLATEIKKHVSIPVIANGDVFSAEDCLRILQFTGADMAMIGRGCFGNPWLFQQCAAALEGNPIPPLPPLSERCDLAVRQIELTREDKGERVAILEARRHYAWYLKGVPHANYYKDQIVRMNTMEDVYRVTAGIKRDLK